MDNFEMTNDRTNIRRSGLQDFFLYVFCIISLYVSSVSFVGLLYAIINKNFSDALFANNVTVGAKWSIALLIIFFPIYLSLSWIINKSILKFPESSNFVIRKTLYYFTLFVAGLTIAIDLATLIFYFLDGEITTRFILKVLSILVVGGTVLFYYLYDLRRDPTLTTNRPKVTAIIVSVIVIAILILGLVTVGSPLRARKIKFDIQRVRDLTNIQRAISLYYKDNDGRLPMNLDILSQSTSYYLTDLKDPETKIDYAYDVFSQNQYKLCAIFSLDSSEQEKDYYYEDTRWQHPAGLTCFTRVAGELPVDSIKK